MLRLPFRGRTGWIRSAGIPTAFATLAGVAVAISADATTGQSWSPRSEPREWKHILIHHSATEVGSVEAIDAVHRQRRDANGNPWLGIGYHFVIGNGHGMEDGAVAATFRWDQQLAGAHAGDEEYNSLGIGICLIGNFEETPPTDAQLDAMYALIEWLRTEYALPPEALARHLDVRSTACPGRLFPWEDVSRHWNESFPEVP
jgi:N-acetyl-anhydromuramyl-L-alanine amidase AmpD